MNKNSNENSAYERDNPSDNVTEAVEDHHLQKPNITTLSGHEFDGGYVMYKRRWFGMLAIFMLNLSTGLVWLTFNAVPDISAEWLHTGKSHVNLSVSCIQIFCVFFLWGEHFTTRLIGDDFKFSKKKKKKSFGLCILGDIVLRSLYHHVFSKRFCIRKMGHQKSGKLNSLKYF